MIERVEPLEGTNMSLFNSIIPEWWTWITDQAMDVNQGGVPKAVLKSQRKLTDVQAGKLQAQWMTKTQTRGGAPPVLPPELDFETLSWSPKDMALIETQEFNALALAAAHGIPAVLLNMAIRFGMTYQNPGMLGEMWWRFELRPTAKGIADALSTQALPAGQWVWFDATDTFLPIEPQNTAQAAGPFAASDDDPEAANLTTTDVQAQPPAAASASPASRLKAVNG
jgi:hypothetical protein